ncbi:Mov34/MPN/PAD-1 family protein [Mesobacillus selenatarsenatis]|uniref:JAB domain-containing protein n=1 Tax=Mesobacillus selenatarsenatis (strain DSM 18680 / JCM 14380 / FERM P-15431 / SF-1) TaxID=1321606 RepID=A0A0A8X2R1_MESS1|nr:Mov34/MPN/PAD-1 family protein [Mesobacillus selenatarsenatis]GAM14275.1 hypothetical protein SAMD00020551_2424 [Mesobacillus selenatarsenatis SF-1]
MKELLFNLPDGRTLFIREPAIQKMLGYQQSNENDCEAGGILIGRILIENNHFIIDEVSEPYPTDTRKRHRFIRSQKGHQEYFNALWEEYEGRCFYLGEWHTHPEKVPLPSTVDRRGWRENLSLLYETDSLFFIIVGTEKIKVWYGKCGTGEIACMEGGWENERKTSKKTI